MTEPLTPERIAAHRLLLWTMTFDQPGPRQAVIELADALTASATWQTDWPTEKGWYWFHGVRTSMAEKPSLIPVRVRHDSTGKAVYVAAGVFLYRDEGAAGVWMPMIVPPPPDGSGDGA